MRETRLSGSEGGGASWLSLPLSVLEAPSRQQQLQVLFAQIAQMFAVGV